MVNMCLMKLPILVFVAQSALAATCADPSSLHPPDTAITLAQTVEAGAFTPPGGPRQGPNIFQTLPARTVSIASYGLPHQPFPQRLRHGLRFGMRL
jgi:hypothetical protein